MDEPDDELEEPEVEDTPDIDPVDDPLTYIDDEDGDPDWNLYDLDN